MDIEWLVTDVTAVCPAERAEHAILEMLLVGCFLCQFTPFLWSGSHSIALGSPDRAERSIMGGILAWHVFWPTQALLWSGSHFLVYIETPS